MSESETIATELIRAIQIAARTGYTVYGLRQVKKLVLHGKAKAIVIASNIQPDAKRDLTYYAKLGNIPILLFPGTNMELGALLGRPHSIQALAIIDPGQSNILELATRRGEQQ
ncbi:MAG: 50S ribosomal protein L30e [Desulfurococcaceae archaeon]